MRSCNPTGFKSVIAQPLRYGEHGTRTEPALAVRGPSKAVHHDGTARTVDHGAMRSFIYPVHTIIRNFFGSMTRKLSVTSSQ
jgi:hypothetical protein